MSHCIITKQVIPAIKSSVELKSEVHFVCRTQVKKIMTPADIIKASESNFTERTSEEVSMSQEDIGPYFNGLKSK